MARQSVRCLALFSLPDTRQNLLRERFMAEAGLVTISKETACARLAQELAREAIRSGADPLQFHKDLRSSGSLPTTRLLYKT